jgi:hypothetical protein
MKKRFHLPCVAVPAAIAAMTLATDGRADSHGTSSAPSAPPTSAYIEQPQSSTTVVSSSFSGPYSDHWAGSSGPYVGIYASSTVTHYEPRRYFFPPVPPALGEPYFRNRTKAASLTRSTIPVMLADYVNEPFYAPLSPMLFEENLSRKRSRMLEDYRAAKQALIEELRAKIASLRDSAPAAREAELAAFAAQQTPRVAEVEAKAYAFRDELTHWSLLGSEPDWNEGRDWRLGDDTRYESTLDEAKLMRGAAFFQDGLSPAQRRLLREYAMELDDSGRGAGADLALDARGPFLYFTPETSRIRVPANLPAELAAKIASYTQQKAALKKELRDTLYREDRRLFASHRTRALRELAARQADRIAAVEQLAEEIRRGLAEVPEAGHPSTTLQGFPPEIAKRLTAFTTARVNYERTLTSMVSNLRHTFPSSRVEVVKAGQGYVVQIVPHRRLSDADRARVETSQRNLEPFNETQVRTYVSLVRERAAIREALVKSSGPLSQLMTARVVDVFLRELGSSVAVQELWQQYDDYEVAVLQPGLSPEQRRMLYDAALVKLDQQLPHYTY